MTRKRPAWWQEAEALSKLGMSGPQIGRQLGHGKSAVQQALASLVGRPRVRTRAAPEFHPMFEAHTPRKIAAVYPRAAVLAAIRASEGAIARAELTRMMRG